MVLFSLNSVSVGLRISSRRQHTQAKRFLIRFDDGRSTSLCRVTSASHFRSFSQTRSPRNDTHHHERPPLILRLPPPTSSGDNGKVFPILQPDTATMLETTIKDVESPEDIVHAVEEHYALEGGEDEEQFVGGMGESDAGVLLIGSSSTTDGDGIPLVSDPLEYEGMIREGIELAKEKRHGVPFGLYTSGLMDDALATDLTYLSALHVSLMAGSPVDYAKVTGLTNSDFSKVCGFIVTHVETGSTIHACLKAPFDAAGGRDLALSLGAIDVQVFK